MRMKVRMMRTIVARRDEVSAVYAGNQAAFKYALALERPDATLKSMGQFPREVTPAGEAPQPPPAGEGPDG
eukprot:13642536-Heterocapsa_arctica.AAC.1